MDEVIRSALGAWENFYIIVGSSAGALTGLQFVVIALVADARGIRSTGREVDAFGTPTVVHFCMVLLVSAVVSAPWHRVGTVSLVLAACGLGGVAYTGVVVRRARLQTGYAPVMEDWVWHAILPLIAYAGLLAGAVAMHSDPEPGLFAIATASLALVFIGIHNAWDTVSYVAIQNLSGSGEG
ncbi:MAG TPA: hypothetical protein VEI47_00410, partial [Gemmatimonadales bacterium]|nr:hypothetical protein [Gemmatimonadales bacterium]